MDYQNNNMEDSLCCLIKKATEDVFTLQKGVEQVCQSILAMPYREIDNPRNLKGVSSLLCAIHTYKI